MHDLIVVAVLDAHLAKARTRNDLEVALHRDPKGVETEEVDHLGHARSAGHPSVLAIDPNGKAVVETH
jgi:hypothetical protein